MNRRRILIHSLIFSPDGVSTAYLYNDIALAFRNAGYEVVVLTTTPHFNVLEQQLAEQPMKWGIWGLYKKSNFHGIEVYHVPQKKFKSTLLRIAGFAYWHVISFFVGLTIRHVDVILSPSPPLTIGRINNLLGKLKKCKVVYNVQEIYPDILGIKSGPIYKFLSRMERRVYNSSDAVTTIDQVFHDTIANRFKDRGKLHVIPNFVDTSLYYKRADTDSLDAGIFPKTDALKLMYAGNIGLAQDWKTLVRLAEKTKDLNIEYFIIGDGAMRQFVEDKVRMSGLDKVHLLPYQARENMPTILSYSDAQFIFMTPEAEGMGFPSKVYTIMACGKPLIVCSGENTPIVNFLSPLGCARIITEHDMELKTNEIVGWMSDISRNELEEMGRKGERILLDNYSKEIITARYVKLIDSLL